MSKEGLYYLKGPIPSTPLPGEDPEPWGQTEIVGKALPRVDAYERVSGGAVYPSDVVLPAMNEGDAVSRGQRLCDLENSVEQEQVALARAKVALAQKALELSDDEMKRAEKLYKKRVDTEYQYTQAKLQKELELKRLKVAAHELDLSKARLDQTVLRSTIDGRVYKAGFPGF